MNLYSIFDQKVSAYNDPFCMSTDMAAQRAFVSNFMDPNTPASVRLNAADYALYRVGAFNIDTGTLLPELSPALVFDGKSIGAPE